MSAPHLSPILFVVMRRADIRHATLLYMRWHLHTYDMLHYSYGSCGWEARLKLQYRAKSSLLEPFFGPASEEEPHRNDSEW